MEANLGLNGYTGYQIVFTKELSLSEAQDSVVTDTLPDIASVLSSSGCVLIRSKDVAEGHIRLEANIPARVCCAGEDGQRFCLDVNIPFYISAEDDAIPDGGACMAELKLKHLETRLLNPRKISVRAEIGVVLNCYDERDETFCTAPPEPDRVIHVLERETELTAISCVTEKTFVLTDEYELPAESATASEIIAHTADATVQEVRSVGSKLIVKGDVRSALLYLTTDGDVGAMEFSTSFSPIIETESETENALAETKLLLSGMYYEISPVTDGRSVNVELHLVAQAAVRVRQRVRYLSDAYSNAYALQLQRQQRESVFYGKEATQRETFNASVELPGEIAAVIACHAVPSGWTQSADEISVNLRVTLCWRRPEGFCCTERTITHTLRQGTEEAMKLCAVNVTDVFASAGGSGAELRIGLELRGFSAVRRTMDCISAIEYDENAPTDLDDAPTLVILYPGFRSDLWTLAKENRSTVEAICAANDMEPDSEAGDRLLMIPKTV